MPCMNGHDLALKIRLTDPSLPIVPATGYAEMPYSAAIGLRRLPSFTQRRNWPRRSRAPWPPAVRSAETRLGRAGISLQSGPARNAAGQGAPAQKSCACRANSQNPWIPTDRANLGRELQNRGRLSVDRPALNRPDRSADCAAYSHKARMV
jgi:hypothetical protein